jgi:hypothetical protein
MNRIELAALAVMSASVAVVALLVTAYVIATVIGAALAAL